MDPSNVFEVFETASLSTGLTGMVSKGLGLAWAALGMLLVAMPATAQNLTTLTLPIAWAEVPPTGSAAANNLTANCICNLNPFVCDVGCCCDPFCEVINTVTNTTESVGPCLPEGFPDQTLDFCVPKSVVERVRLWAGACMQH